mmetsp:Transcript_63586/g.199113  ORF Transcript_63586/g.199113 Transcript_63586/m.199113 type:complete len:258 (+) Transcript_63586:59-832(+)
MRNTRRKLKGPRVQHVVLLGFPTLEEESEDRRLLDEIVRRTSGLPGIQAAFHRYGTRTLKKEELLAELGKPDLSIGTTHCIYMVSDHLDALKKYLHGDTQKKELSPQMGKFLTHVFVMDTDLGLDLAPAAGAQEPMLQIVLLRFQVHVTRESEVYSSFQEVIAEFGKCPGIRAALRPAGWGQLSKDEMLRHIDWPDRTMSFTHCLTIAADSLAELKSLLGSEVYGRWLKTESPHLFNDGKPAALIFHMPLQVTASMC